MIKVKGKIEGIPTQFSMFPDSIPVGKCAFCDRPSTMICIIQPMGVERDSCDTCSETVKAVLEIIGGGE